MGGAPSTTEPSTGALTTVAPVTSSTSCFSSHYKQEHVIFAFFTGVLLMLMLTALIFLIIKSCRKCHSSPQALDPNSEPPTKLSSTSKESLTYASMTFKPSEEKSDDLTGEHSTGLDLVVYSQVKVANPRLPLQ